jgi:hypothetical protein
MTGVSKIAFGAPQIFELCSLYSVLPCTGTGRVEKYEPLYTRLNGERHSVEYSRLSALMRSLRSSVLLVVLFQYASSSHSPLLCNVTIPSIFFPQSFLIYHTFKQMFLCCYHLCYWANKCIFDRVSIPTLVLGVSVTGVTKKYVSKSVKETDIPFATLKRKPLKLSPRR